MAAPEIDGAPEPTGPRRVRNPWRQAVILVCRECDGSPGVRPKHVRTSLKAAVEATVGKRAVRVLSAGCLDVCPKRAVTVALLGSSHTTVVIRERDECTALVAPLEAAPAQ
jgi:hypothetical protein